MIVARALEALEEQLDKSLHETFRLLAGTSTGAIIAAAIVAGLTGKEMLSVNNARSWSLRTGSLISYFPIPLSSIQPRVLLDLTLV